MSAPEPTPPRQGLKQSWVWLSIKMRGYSPAERLLVRAVLFLMLLAVGSVGFTARLLWKMRPSLTVQAEHEPAEAEAGEEHAAAESGGEEGGEEEEHGAAPELGSSPLPPELKALQGRPEEPDKDLVDPEIKTTRGLASIINDDLKVSVGSRFVEIPNVFAGSQSGRPDEAIVIADIVLEVNSAAAERELESRKVEFNALISSLIAERPQQKLRKYAEVLRLKIDIQREINHALRQGRVEDVLFSNFNVK